MPGPRGPVARAGPGGGRVGAGPDPGERALVRARHFSASSAKLGGNAPSASRGDAPVSDPAYAKPEYDAVVVGAGPNGLTAAALLATAGYSVLLLEAAEKIGGGASTEALTLPGYWHDVCSAIHPLAAGSPAFAPLALERHGLELAHPELAPRAPTRRRHRRRHRPRLHRDRRVARCRRGALALDVRTTRARLATRSSKTCRGRSSTSRATRSGSHVSASPRSRRRRRSRGCGSVRRARERSSRAWPRTRCSR